MSKLSAIVFCFCLWMFIGYTFKASAQESTVRLIGHLKMADSFKVSPYNCSFEGQRFYLGYHPRYARLDAAYTIVDSLHADNEGCFELNLPDGVGEAYAYVDFYGRSDFGKSYCHLYNDTLEVEVKVTVRRIIESCFSICRNRPTKNTITQLSGGGRFYKADLIDNWNDIDVLLSGIR